MSNTRVELPFHSLYGSSMNATLNPIDLSQLPTQHLQGIGSRLAEQLAKLGIYSVQDILFHLPLRYQDRTRVYPLASLTVGDHVVIDGHITTVTSPRVGKTRLLCQMRDATGRIYLRFFHVNPAQRTTLKEGAHIRCFGEVRRGQYGLELIHPEYRLISPDTLIPVEENLTPIYPTTEGLSQLMWRKLTQQALHLLEKGAVLHDILPDSVLQTFNFPSLKQALIFVHRPPADAPVNLLLEGKHISQKRLAFEELLAHRLSLLNLKQSFQLQQAHPLIKKDHLIAELINQLPFKLTTAQQNVLVEIDRDLAKPHPMLRLVQGDVGSGKTIVAAIALLQAIENGYQAAVLAPTELLVEQHYRNFDAWLTPLGVKVGLLSGHMKASVRRNTLAALAKGEIHIIVGTHAIFQKQVEFEKLVLIIVDEQHRFGVQQRALLREKGVNANFYPHQLIMTATPIPRTLAMSVYADLDYSIIDELPPGRTPVNTLVISNSRRDEVITRIHEACVSGRQAYWVCTLIAESDVLQCQAAEETAAALQQALSDLKIGLIHGRMKPKEKEDVMGHFKQGQLDLLVATTVIEVGVDVPNASLMIIENAERLGLAQLHQLRGRIGRGKIASHCVLLYQMPLSQLAKQRLAVMRETTDGFKIAQRDLELRGPGEVLGTRQTGEINLRVADLMRDAELLPFVQQAAYLLLKEYAHLTEPLIKRWLGQGEQYARV